MTQIITNYNFPSLKLHKFGLMWVANGGVATEREGIDFGSIAYPIAFAAFDIGMDIGVDGHKCD